MNGLVESARKPAFERAANLIFAAAIMNFVSFMMSLFETHPLAIVCGFALWLRGRVVRG